MIEYSPKAITALGGLQIRDQAMLMKVSSLVFGIVTHHLSFIKF